MLLETRQKRKIASSLVSGFHHNFKPKSERSTRKEIHRNYKMSSVNLLISPLSKYKGSFKERGRFEMTATAEESKCFWKILDNFP